MDSLFQIYNTIKWLYYTFAEYLLLYDQSVVHNIKR